MKAKHKPLEADWTAKELAIFRSLSSPAKVQQYLDRLRYSADPFTRSPREVMRDKKANCFDGALFAAAALNRIGYPPLLIDMRAVNDDDHVIAVFKRNGAVGAVGKSNFVGLRFREPVFRNTRELVMSYFESFFNLAGQKTLRSYAEPFNLVKARKLNWLTSGEKLDDLSDILNALPHRPIMSAGMIRSLQPVDRRTFRAETIGLDKRGAYKV